MCGCSMPGTLEEQSCSERPFEAEVANKLCADLRGRGQGETRWELVDFFVCFK